MYECDDVMQIRVYWRYYGNDDVMGIRMYWRCMGMMM